MHKVIGIGTDLVEVARVVRAQKRFGDHFLKRIFTESELSYCLPLANPGPHLAARFAAKEAVAKAFGTGIGAELDWTSIGVVRNDNGRPSIDFDAKGRALLAKHAASDVLISLSHTREHALAYACLIG